MPMRAVKKLSAALIGSLPSSRSWIVWTCARGIIASATLRAAYRSRTTWPGSSPSSVFFSSTTGNVLKPKRRSEIIASTSPMS